MRPTKLTPEIQSQIVEFVRRATPIETAAQAVGITSRTFERWMVRGLSDERKDAPYRAFREAVESARADCEATLVGRIVNAANGKSWLAAAWLLERGFDWKKPIERKNADSEPAQKTPDPFAEADELAKRRVRA